MPPRLFHLLLLSFTLFVAADSSRSFLRRLPSSDQHHRYHHKSASSFGGIVAKQRQRQLASSSVNDKDQISAAPRAAEEVWYPLLVSLLAPPALAFLEGEAGQSDSGRRVERPGYRTASLRSSWQRQGLLKPLLSYFAPEHSISSLLFMISLSPTSSTSWTSSTSGRNSLYSHCGKNGNNLEERHRYDKREYNKIRRIRSVAPGQPQIIQPDNSTEELFESATKITSTVVDDEDTTNISKANQSAINATASSSTMPDTANITTLKSNSTADDIGKNSEIAYAVSAYIIATTLIMVFIIWNIVIYDIRLGGEQQEQLLRYQREHERSMECKDERLMAVSEQEFNELLPLITFDTYWKVYSNAKRYNIVSKNTAQDDRNHCDCLSKDTHGGNTTTATADGTIRSNRSKEEMAIGAKIVNFQADSESSSATKNGVLSRKVSSISSLSNVPCPICLEEIQEPGEYVRMLPRCHHIYHPDCIRQWLLGRSRSDFCPLCKVTVKMGICKQKFYSCRW